jgi:hypothetical protein
MPYLWWLAGANTMCVLFNINNQNYALAVVCSITAFGVPLLAYIKRRSR